MTSGVVERFVGLIRDETGNVVPPARHHFVAGVLERRAAAAGLSGPDAYLDALAEGRLPDEWQRLVPMVTIKESYFFRAPQQFRAIGERVLPYLARRRGGVRRLVAWCAAAARGEEAGTLALVLAESELVEGWEWRIVATDLDAEALETARRGLYGERSVAHVPPALLERWFRRRGKLYELSPALRQRIEYRPLNLVRPLAGLDREGPFDLVLLRNVLIYFRRPVQRRVLSAAADLLAADGTLFLGASETLWQVQDRLAAYDLGSCFCYRHRPEGSQLALHPFPETEEGAERGDTPVRTVAEGAAPAAGSPRASAAAPERGRPRREIGGPAGEPLGERGRETGTAAAEAAPSPSAGPSAEQAAAPGPVGVAPADGRPAPHLLHADPCGAQERLAAAARRLVGNDLDAAERELAAMLASEPSEPAAHALDGFLHDLRGNLDEAVTAYRAALYLDPALYQVRLLLADLFARRGLRDRAAHQYREVLALIEADRHRALVALDELPLPDRRGAERRCRLALRSA